MIASEKPVRVLIADSQFLITESLTSILNNDGRYYVTRVVAEKNELIEALKAETVSVLIIDPALIDLAGISELREIKDSYQDLRFLIISNSLNKSELHELKNSGIKNIILKTTGKEEIFEALSAALKGRQYYSNDLLEILLNISDKKNSGEVTGKLTNSEIEIVRLISEGCTTKDIATRRHISFHTVITHRKNIFRKLGVSSVSELLMYAIKSGWINMIEYHI